jgi:hypothetical protein
VGTGTKRDLGNESGELNGEDGNLSISKFSPADRALAGRFAAEAIRIVVGN